VGLNVPADASSTDDARGFLDFSRQVVFVSGAGNVGEGIGNGKAAAIQFARRGARVFALDIIPAAVEATVAMIAAEGHEAVAHVADVTSLAQMEAAMAACIARFGGLDVMVNNVGGSAPGSAATMPEDTWNAQIAMNLSSAFFGCRVALPHLIAGGGGAIVNVASIAALRMQPDRTHVAYTAAKQGVIGLTRSVAIDHARRGIRCNTVIPGLINTPLVSARLANQVANGDAAALIALRDAKVPMGRMGTCWDVANAVVFLASTEAGHITGTELVVDGGIAAAMA
jgi:NAD(P)-dependent dehydrogenase (short-subunit alcohol dehydrogenase family)